MLRAYAMASLIDSEAHFSKRAGEVRLGDAALRTLRRLGLNSMGSLAYAHGQPGQPLDEASFTNWVQSTVNANVSLGDMSAIKRLLFESQTLALAALREQVVNPDSAALKKVPEAERDRRMKHLRDTLIGVLIEGPMEPGHALLDLCAQQRESGQLRYIPPERCISRVHEVTTASNPKKQLEFESDKLSIKEQVVVPDMQVHDSLKLLEAFRRRGLAYAFAEAVLFLDYERYVNSLFSHCHREPPPGYSRCALPQLVQADKLVFTKLIEDGVKPRRDAAGVCPMDAALMKALESYQVSFALLPLPTKAVIPQAKKSEGNHDPPAKKHKGGGAGKGKGKSKASGKGRGPAVPYQILQAGGKGRTPDGESICYDYGLGKCKHGADGGECNKGRHVCPVCFEPHTLAQHKKSSK